MTNADFAMRKCIYTFVALIFSGGYWSMTSAQCPSMACNNSVQISVETDCNIEFNADILLEGDESAQGTTFTLSIPGLSVSNMTIPASSSGVEVVTSPFPLGTYEYTLMNQCGNSCWGEIIVEDNILPNVVDTAADPAPCPVGSPCSITCLEEDWVLNSDVYTGSLDLNPEFEDSCGNLGTISFMDMIVEDPVTCAQKTITRVWKTTLSSHGSNNTVDLYTQVFVLTPVDINLVNCPQNLKENGAMDDSLPCTVAGDPDSIADFFDDLDTEDVNEGLPFAYPTFGGKALTVGLSCNLGVSFSDQVIPLCGSGDKASRKIVRNWTLLDWCDGDTRECIQIIEIKDTEGPIAHDLPANYHVSVAPWKCTADITLDAPKYVDECSTVASVGYQLKDPQTGAVVLSGNSYTISNVPVGCYNLMYVATDECGNQSMSDNIPFTVADVVPPVAVSDEDIVVSLTGQSENGDGVAKLFPSSVDAGSHDACSDVYIQIRRDKNEFCAFPGNDTYDADGECGGCDQMIFIPFTAVPVDFLVNQVAVGGRVLPLAYPYDLSDPAEVARFLADCLDLGYTVTETETATGVEVLIENPGEDFEYITVNEKGNNFYFSCVNCDEEPTDPDNGEFVKFCCADLTDVSPDGVEFGIHKVWIRVWDDGNGDGIYGNFGDNFNESWTNVRVENKLAPQIICPEPVVISCLDDVNDLSLTGTAKANSACGVEPVNYSDLRDLNGCGMGVIQRTWFVDADNDGTPDAGKPRCTQVITLTGGEVFDGNDIDFPSDTIIDCTLLGSLDDQPFWDDEGTCTLIGYSLQSDTFNFEEDACLKVINKWTVIDWCQYDPSLANSDGIWTGFQIIKVLDNTAPEFDVCDAEDKIIVGAYEDCATNAVTIGKTAFDAGNCASPWLKWEVQLDIDADWTIDYTYSSDFQFDAIKVLPVTSSGQEMSFTLVDELGKNLALSAGKHRLVWIVKDGCGNRTQCTSTLIIEDQKPPTPYCVQSLSTAVMQNNGSVAIWAVDFDLGSFDNCTPRGLLEYSFSGDSIQTSVTVSCVGGGGDFELTNGISETYSLEMWVWDQGADVNHDGVISLDERNRDYCLVTLRVDDNVDACPDSATGTMAMIAGSVATEHGQTIEEAAVMLNSNRPEYPAEQMTNDQGKYAFSNNPMYEDYQVSVSYEDDHLNGVSTLDLVMIQRHLLGITLLDSPYKVIAADVNNSESVSGSDLVEIRKLILGITSEFPNSDSWRFVDAAQTFDQPINPWPINQMLDIQDMDHDMMAEDFIAVKIGDVNNSAEVNGAVSTVVRSIAHLTAMDQTVNAGSTVSIELSLEQAALHGMQYTMTHPGLELVSISSATMQIDPSHYSTGSGMTVFSWHAQSNAIDGADQLMTLTFEATETVTLSDVLRMSDEVAQSEVYLGDRLETMDLDLRFETSEIDTEIVLLQNEPNPFSELTRIGFVLPSAMDATLNIFDVTGKVVYSLTDRYAAGYNSLEIKRDMIAGKGILYYQLDSEQSSTTRTMLLID